MSALAIALVLLSALFHALRSLFTKESGDKQIFLWLYSIVGLRQTSIVFAVLMGSHILKEKHRGIRLTGALIIFAGGFLISLAR